MTQLEPRDGNLLRNMLRQRDLPQCVVDEYFKRKQYLDRVSAGFCVSDLLDILFTTGVLNETEENPVPAKAPPPKPEIPEQPEEWPEGALKKGLPVQTFHGENMVEGMIQTVRTDEDGFFVYGVKVEFSDGLIVAKDEELEIPGE